MHALKPRGAPVNTHMVFGGDDDNAGGAGAHHVKRGAPAGGEADSHKRPRLASFSAAPDPHRVRTRSFDEASAVATAAAAASDGAGSGGVSFGGWFNSGGAPGSGAMRGGVTVTATESSAKPRAVSEFDISAATVGHLAARGIATLFPVQALSYEHAMRGADILGRARTGMGKTLAFALPIVERLRRAAKGAGAPARGRPPCVLVLAPTRELAQQVAKDFVSIAPCLVTLCVYGGAPIERQKELLFKVCCGPRLKVLVFGWVGMREQEIRKIQIQVQERTTCVRAFGCSLGCVCVLRARFCLSESLRIFLCELLASTTRAHVLRRASTSSWGRLGGS